MQNMDFLWNQKSIFGIRNQFSVSEIRISDIEKWFCMFDIMHYDRYWFIDIKKKWIIDIQTSFSHKMFSFYDIRKRFSYIKKVCIFKYVKIY